MKCEEMNELDAMTVPLCGRNIVEAGAGTGKTYSIQTLVARLVAEKGVPCDRICIVTFSREATAELFRRLREVLEDAAELACRQEMKLLKGEEEKQRVLDVISRALEVEGVDRQTIADRMNRAVTDFDAMRISTIHGFCFRALSEFAVEGRMRMALELMQDGSGRVKKCFEDFCRNMLYSRPDSPELFFLWNFFDFSPEMLMKKLAKVCVSDVEISFGNTANVKENFDPAKGAADIYRLLQKCIQDIGQLFPDLCANLRLMLDMDPDAAAEKVIACISRNIADASGTIPEAVTDFYSGLKCFHDSVLAAASDFVRAELSRRAEEEGVVDNDLVLSILRDRITDREYGETLAKALADRFDAVFVDEFQDTDPVQLDIFTAINNQFSPEKVSFFIGDPKQAIYAFRGGDINSYLMGFRNVPPENRYTLSCNRRSGKDFIDSMNRFYGSLQTPFAVPEIKYKKAGCSQINDRIFFDDAREKIPAFSFMKKDYGNIAAEISSLIADPNCRIFIQREKLPEPRRLRPSDFAVLVHANRDCIPVAEALHKFGIPTIIYNAENAFKADEIKDFTDFLQAILHPADTSLWKRVLSGMYFGFTAGEIAGEDVNYENFVQQNIALNSLWHEQSLETMFLAADNHYKFSQRIFSRMDGKRLWILNRKWLDLAAVLEEKENLAPEMLLWRFIQEKDAEYSSFSEDERSIQLQDDEDAVKIMSIHKSKGLQFPVVYVYDISLETSQNKSALFHKNDLRYADLSMERSAAELCEAESVAELLRLAYVAVTRAQVMFRGGIKSQRLKKASFVNYSRINPELSGDRWREGMNKALQKKASSDPFALSSLDIVPCEYDIISKKDGEKMEGRVWNSPQLVSGWSRTSFSALTAADYGGDGSMADETADDRDEEDIPNAGNADTLFAQIAAFPAGARTGNAWHEMLAELPFASRKERICRCVKTKLAGYALPDDEDTVDNITAMLQELFSTVLPGACGGFCLRDVSAEDTVAELEFTAAVQVESALADICRNLPEYGMESPSRSKHSADVITGAMDLVFRHGGKYYLADWKSNRLGAVPSAYSQDAVAGVMKNKHYILQALIYLYMLKKYLRWDRERYENEFGGIYYFFLRGCCSDVPGRGIWCHKPEWETLENTGKVLAGYGY